ncbi:uncharacterized protein LOC107263032 [Cephus cinctus]|uniref:Uncharacterized protein LOC107263032 n=1 Tax=Cephus cinctus TaxID=211228 RepID=A0AAJ7BGC8_CEPCN|nr:uncharacterized protein LOC107263032 [Cephus cinctus]
MKESCVLSKGELGLPKETDLFYKKNGFSNKTKVRGKFCSIFKFLMYLLLIISLILTAYVLLDSYKTVETGKGYCGTLIFADEEEKAVQPTEELRTMTNGTENNVIDFLQSMNDSATIFYESEYDYTTISPVIEDTENEAVTRMMTSTTELSEKNIMTLELLLKEFAKIPNQFLSFSTETSESDSNEITHSPKYNGTFDNVESLGISPDKITWRNPEEDSSEETSEKVTVSILDLLHPERLFDIKVRDEVDKSNLESTSVYYATRPTSTYVDNDTLDPDYTNLAEIEQLDPISLPPKSKNCEMSKDAVDADTNTGTSNWTCESDEDTTGIVTENPSDSKYSTTEPYGDIDGFKKLMNLSSFTDDYVVRNNYYSGDDVSDKTKSYEDYEDYYDYMADEEKESNKQIQGKNMKEEEKEDYVPEENFYDKSLETPEEPTVSSTEIYEVINPLEIFKRTSEIPHRTYSPSAIEIDSSKSNEEQVSDEDIVFDQIWDELFSKLYTVHDDDTLSTESFSEKVESNYFKILCMILNVTLKYTITHPVAGITDEDRRLMKIQMAKLRNVTDICDNISNFTSDSALNRMITEISELHWDESEEESHKVKRSVASKIPDNLTNRLMIEKKPAEILYNAIQTRKTMLLQKLAQIDDNYYQSLESNLEEFFNRMELLSQHIDRLHERYLKMNELSDDYISKEFPMETW